jgi:glutamine amidotransferase
MIVVVDYGMANIGSVLNMFRKVGAAAVASADVATLRSAKKIVLPGVGAFGSAMDCLRRLDLLGPLTELAMERRVPVLGICLGMQLLLESSEEGDVRGLGWIPGRVRRFAFSGEDSRLRIPHMGWNELKLAKESRLFQGVSQPQRFYFVHSYHAQCENAADVLGTASYGYEFAAAVERDNIAGTQFHPEKSHRFGMRLFQAFAEN